MAIALRRGVAWASTLSFSSYWVHPSALAGFPAAELAWMALSPLAMVGLVAGAATVVRGGSG